MSYWVSEQSIKVILFYPKPEANTLYAYHNLWSEPGKLDNHPKDQEYSQVKNSHKHTSISKE